MIQNDIEHEPNLKEQRGINPNLWQLTAEGALQTELSGTFCRSRRPARPGDVGGQAVESRKACCLRLFLFSPLSLSRYLPLAHSFSCSLLLSQWENILKILVSSQEA